MNRKTKTRTPYSKCQICGRFKPLVKDTPFPVVVSLWDTQHQAICGKWARSNPALPVPHNWSYMDVASAPFTRGWQPPLDSKWIFLRNLLMQTMDRDSDFNFSDFRLCGSSPAPVENPQPRERN